MRSNRPSLPPPPAVFNSPLPFDLVEGQRRLTNVITPLSVWYEGHGELLNFGALDIVDFRRISRLIPRGNAAFYVVSPEMARMHGTPDLHTDRLRLTYLRQRIGFDELETHSDYMIIKDVVYVRDGVVNGIDFFLRHDLLPDITKVLPLSDLWSGSGKN